MKGVKVILRDGGGKYVLQFRDGAPGVEAPLQWNLYGGAVEDGENDVDAAMRELREELNLQVSKDHFSRVGHHIINGNDVSLLRCDLHMKHTDQPIREGAGIGFFAEEELLRIPLTEDSAYLLRKYVLR